MDFAENLGVDSGGEVLGCPVIVSLLVGPGGAAMAVPVRKRAIARAGEARMLVSHDLELRANKADRKVRTMTGARM